MRLSCSRITLTKRHALTISRGSSAGSINVVLRVDDENWTGIGEMAPSDVTGDSAEATEAAVQRWSPLLAGLGAWELERARELLTHDHAGSATFAALDLAMHDWIGTRADLPLWKLWGGDLRRVAPTSLTIGINPPEMVRALVPEILNRTGAVVLKVKLGQPAGLDADRDMFVAAREAAAGVGRPVAWRVDANGGWTTNGAAAMIPWLAEQGVELVEQPLAQGDEDGLPSLYSASPVPIFGDESIRDAHDVARFADRYHGVNLKLMKCGGLAEARRIIATARAHRLQVMIGCMGESSLAISAGAQLAPFVDHLDLDSHLNLLDDPFDGATMSHGTLRPTDRAGLGVQRKAHPK